METRTTSPVSEPAFHADDLEVANYRSLSALAVVSLVFGLAAPLCFAAPVFMAIPLFGTAVSLLALRRIDASDGSLAGRGAAMVGLALCVASGVAALSHAQATRFLHVRQAEDFGRHWLAVVNSGQLEEAFKLTVTGSRPEPPPAPGMPEPKESPLESFTHNALIQELSAVGAGAEIRAVETVSYDPRPGRQCIVVQHFSVTPASGPNGTESGNEPVEALLTVQLSRQAGETRLHWLVNNFQDPAQGAQQVPGI